MSGDDYRIDGVNISVKWKNERIARNKKRICGILDNHNIKYEEDGGCLYYSFDGGNYVVGLNKGKVRKQGKATWYNFSETFMIPYKDRTK